MTSPSHVCSPAWTLMRIADASVSLFGAKTRQLRAAPEGRPVDPFAGRREQHLLDHVADVIVVARVGRASSAIESEWEVDVHEHTLITSR